MAASGEATWDQIVTTPGPASDVDEGSGVVTGRGPSGRLVRISLPSRGTSLDSTGTPSGDLVQLGRSDTFTTIVRNQSDGAFRAFLRLNSAQAPREYAFTVDVGAGGTLRQAQDGSVSALDGSGLRLGTFATPWAVNAKGRPVQTSYAVQGNTIVQTVHPTASTTFPVIADPFWIPALAVVARLSVHVIQRAAARGVSQAMIRQVVQNGRRTKGNGNTSIFTQGSGKSRIRVVVNNNNGTIITVTKG